MSWTSKLEIAHLQDVEECLAYALGQVEEKELRALISQEFWHALNRRGVVPNALVESRAHNTVARCEQHCKMHL